MAVDISVFAPHTRHFMRYFDFYFQNGSKLAPLFVVAPQGGSALGGRWRVEGPEETTWGKSQGERREGHGASGMEGGKYVGIL